MPDPRQNNLVQNADAFEGSVAIVGMDGRFPGAHDVQTFWHALLQGKDCITRFSREELLEAGVPPELLNRDDYVAARGVLEGADLFDAEFFDMSPRESELTDPQQRLFLESAWMAMENAGIAVGQFGVRSVGVYGGTGWPSYLLSNVASLRDIVNSAAGHQIILGNDKDNLTLRVSYKLGLAGPSITVQTGCSSSLVAIALAYNSLVLHQCDVAIAGGVSVIFPQHGYTFRDGGIFSPNGCCRPFDAAARGTVLGGGVGTVVLKRLVDAVADRHHIYAVIRSAAVNNDGRSKAGYSAPSAEAQSRVISNAIALAGMSPDDISYIEAHGTGTRLGDPIEMEGLNRVFRGRSRHLDACLVGSVKSNIGHLDVAAGVASLIKTAKALECQLIPATLNFSEGNPEIDWSGDHLRVCNSRVRWERSECVRRAGVSSFGLGGTNAHIVLEEAPNLVPAKSEKGPTLILLSAKTPTALDQQVANLVKHLEENPNINMVDIAHTLAVGRCQFNHRLAIVCSSTEQLRSKLIASENAHKYRGMIRDILGSIAFVFPGWTQIQNDVGRQLYNTEPSFRQHALECMDLIQSLLGVNLRDLFDSEPVNCADGEKEIALFVVEYSMAKLWLSWGIVPNAVAGDGVGELAAAVISGVISLETAVKLLANIVSSERNLPEQISKLQLNCTNIPLISKSQQSFTDPTYWNSLSGKQPGALVSLEKHFSGQRCTAVSMAAISGTTDNNASETGIELIASLPAANDSVSDAEFVLCSLARLWIIGTSVRWDTISRKNLGRLVPLPTYPFARRSHWWPPVQDKDKKALWSWFSDKLSDELSSANFLSSVHWNRFLHFEELSSSYARHALTALGLQPHDLDSLTYQTWDRCGIAPEYRQLAKDLLAWTENSPPRLLSNYDMSVDNSEQSIVDKLGMALPEVLSGTMDPRELFREFITETWTDGPPNSLREPYGAALRAAFENVVANQPKDRVLKILEIGGGMGQATSMILPALSPELIDYTFTDVSEFFLSRARRKFAQFPFVNCLKLDFNQCPESQGFKRFNYDIVIAVNVLHTLKNVDAAISRIRSLLTAEGVVLIWEITEPSITFAITYGPMMPSLEDGQRSQGCPFLPTATWENSLTSNGFKRFQTFPIAEKCSERIFLAEVDEEWRAIAPDRQDQTKNDAKSQRRDLGDWGFIPSWQRTPPQSVANTVKVNQELVLVFGAATGVGGELAKKLSRIGYDSLVVEFGSEFNCRTDKHFTIRPFTSADFRSLFNVLLERNKLPKKIVYLWSIEETCQHVSCSSDVVNVISPLIFLAQELGNHTISLEVLIVTAGVHDVVGGDAVNPISALFLGPSRLLPIEYPQISCRTVDLAYTSFDKHVLPSVAHMIQLELDGVAREPTVAYRGGYRWSQSFVPVTIPRPAQFGSLVREGGVYLITGGLGSIGLTIAEYIARSKKATILLTGRSNNLTNPKDCISGIHSRTVLDRLSLLRSLGSTIVPVQADVTDYKQMSNVVRDAENRFGPINGVIHSAGVLGDGSIQRKTIDDLCEVLAPKVNGTLVLDQLFEGTVLDFFVLFSALSSVKPAFGQVAYSAANNFLEAFAAHRSGQGRNTTCISWDVWRNDGMAYDAETPLAFKELKERDIAVRGIEIEEGIDVFGRCLGLGFPVTYISTTGYIANAAFDVTSDYLKQLEKSIRQKKSDSAENRASDLTETETAIAEIWSELLGIREFQSSSDFFKLGGDSLVGMQVISRLDSQFGVKITQENLFKHRTVSIAGSGGGGEAA